jgi:RNA polymerase sigma-70 factor (ECF subfamily)
MVDTPGNSECSGDALLERAIGGNREALDQLLAAHRSRLHRMISLRMDPHLRARLDASDVIQDAFIEALERFPEYVKTPKTSFFLWLRFLTRQKLITLYRHHVGTHARDARKEIQIAAPSGSMATSEGLAAQLLASETSPSQAAQEGEIRAEIQTALDELDPIDREVLALRHFEQLSNTEVAEELGITTAAASKRYLRAARRLKQVLELMRQGRAHE